MTKRRKLDLPSTATGTNRKKLDPEAPFFISDKEISLRLREQACQMGLTDPRNIFDLAADRIELLASQRTSIA